MRKLLTRRTAGLLGLATLVLSACAGAPKVDDSQRSMLDRLPFVYKMPVQQGNIVTAEQVDQLQPGMNKRQVRYLLGTPLLADFFNSDRWDYVYTMRRGHKALERRRVTVLFKDDALVGVEGDLRPNPKPAGTDKAKETMVSVPDYKSNEGLISRALEAIGVKKAN
ncbi:outer membrane protein assembly factor BamE [uncultured Thiodictyon sp.]|jgi:outer membrane protein assembly factor BamE|uniref:outer membrane protein assembly factor BamE n=1 Tax=uncultured Thiodictyon sp. TaxID=1846217 RepID=UPI0025E4FF21|nr:outer membrane protein assembly factor BamE [uncultured Thiodictyon sp.]